MGLGNLLVMIRGASGDGYRGGSVSFRGDLGCGLHFCGLGARPHTGGLGMGTPRGWGDTKRNLPGERSLVSGLSLKLQRKLKRVILIFGRCRVANMLVKKVLGDSLMVQWLGLCAPKTKGPGLIPD